MKFLLIFSIIMLTNSCQQNKSQNQRFDKKSLTDHYRTKNFNLLILLDQRIQNADEGQVLSSHLKEYLSNTMKNNNVRILIAGLDGNPPHFFLTSNSEQLPSDFSSLFYSVDKLKLESFERRYNPNISVLKSTKELIQNYSHKMFFLPQNDFMVMILSTQDDENYAINMQGQKYQDRLEQDVQSILQLNQGQWTIGKGLKQDFTFNQLRVFVIAPKENCHTKFVPADKLFYATTKINTHFTKELENWKREVENFNICNLNFQSYFNSIAQLIESRYEVKIE